MSSVLVRRLISTVLAVAVSAVVLWWLLEDGIDGAMIEALGKASPWPLALGALLAMVIQALRAWRFAILATGNLAMPSWTMVGIATKLVLFNFLLPFKLGEISFPLMMKKTYGTPFGEGAGILILCRLLDLGVVLAMILLTASWLLESPMPGWSPVLIGAFGLLALATPLLIAGQFVRLRRLTRRWPHIDHLAGQMSQAATMLQTRRRRFSVTALTLSIWIGHAVIAWLVTLSIGVDLGFFPMAMASAASNFAFALPISGVAGLGPPQAAWATMLHLAGHDWAPAITSALLCHGLLLVTLSTFGIAFWLGQTLFGKAMIEDPTSSSSARGG